jgi:hypothetical protein
VSGVASGLLVKAVGPLDRVAERFGNRAGRFGSGKSSQKKLEIRPGNLTESTAHGSRK